MAAGAHNGLSARLVEESGFEAVWSSSFEISASAALPDASLLSMSEYLTAAKQMNDAVSIPVIADCDTGFGNNLNAVYAVQQFEAAGIAAVCFEDKQFPKMNSFVGAGQHLEQIDTFARKIKVAKEAQTTKDFMIIARTEALVVGCDVSEALKRAHAYADAGADAILIHSKAKTPDEVLDFISCWQDRLPVVVVPTTYYSLTVEEANAAGVKLMIFANHGMRAMISGSKEVLSKICVSGSSESVQSEIATVQDIFQIQRLPEWLEHE